MNQSEEMQRSTWLFFYFKVHILTNVLNLDGVILDKTIHGDKLMYFCNSLATDILKDEMHVSFDLFQRAGKVISCLWLVLIVKWSFASSTSLRL